MRACYEDVINGNNKMAIEHAKFLNDKFSQEKMYSQFVESVVSVVGDASTEEADNAQVIVL